jgi:hypothetical protein
MIPFIALIFVGGVAAGIWQFVRPGLSPVERLIRGLVSLSIALAAIVVLMRLAQSLSQDWNEAKLAPVVAMTRGYALYQDPSSGVMTGWIYGPIGACYCRPASRVGPTTTVLIGVAIAMIVYLAPAGWVLATASRGGA